eukprot:3976264-Prymnesium_polylepis.1
MVICSGSAITEPAFNLGRVGAPPELLLPTQPPSSPLITSLPHAPWRPLPLLTIADAGRGEGEALEWRGETGAEAE